MFGGALIGLSAAVLLIAIGRIAGLSGILGQALWPGIGETRSWRWVFMLGLPLGAWLVSLSSGGLETQITESPATIVAAGLLVGFGTRLGGGCTSGHGVCGMSRASPRSMVATLVFMSIGGLAVFVVRHVLEGGV